MHFQTPEHELNYYEGFPDIAKSSRSRVMDDLFKDSPILRCPVFLHNHTCSDIIRAVGSFNRKQFEHHDNCHVVIGPEGFIPYGYERRRKRIKSPTDVYLDSIEAT